MSFFFLLAPLFVCVCAFALCVVRDTAAAGKTESGASGASSMAGGGGLVSRPAPESVEKRVEERMASYAGYLSVGREA